MNGYNNHPDEYGSYIPQGNGIPPQARAAANGFVKHYHSYLPSETTSDYYMNGACPTMPMSNRHFGGHPQQQRSMQPPSQRSDMNPNATAFVPRPSGSFNPFGYGASPQRPRSYTPHQPAPQTGYARIPDNYMASYNNGSDYGNVNNGGFSSLGGQPNGKPQQPQNYHQVMQHQQHQQQQQQQQQAMQPRPSDIFMLRQDIVQQKQQSEQELLRRQQDQEAYAQRFLEAVQQRVSAAPPSQGHGQNGYYPGMMGDAGTFFEQDLDSYDFEAQHRQNPPFQLSQDLLAAIEQLPNKIALFEVQIGLEQLLSEPSEYEAWIGAVKDRLASKEISPKDLEVAAWLIIEMGILGEEAQHNFAKLCHHLYERISAFKEHLMFQLHSYHSCRNNLSPVVRQNLLLFMGEVYEQAFAPVGVRNHALVTALVEELQDAIATRPISDLLLKKVVHVLKLCGRHLEMDAGKNSMDELFLTLHSYTLDADRPEGMTDTGAGLVTNLLMFRNSNWGGANDATSRRVHNPSMDLTEDEIQFLDRNGAMNRPIGSSQSGASNSECEEFDSDDYDKYFNMERTAIAAAEKALERLSIEDEDFEGSSAPRDDNATPTPAFHQPR